MGLFSQLVCAFQCFPPTAPISVSPAIQLPSVSPANQPPSVSPAIQLPSVSPAIQLPSVSPDIQPPSVSPMIQPPSGSLIQSPSVSPAIQPPSVSPIIQPPSGSLIQSPSVSPFVQPPFVSHAVRPPSPSLSAPMPCMSRVGAAPPPPLRREALQLDSALMFRQPAGEVQRWLSGAGGVAVPGLGVALPYLPPFVSSLDTLHALLAVKEGLEETAFQLLTPGVTPDPGPDHEYYRVSCEPLRSKYVTRTHTHVCVLQNPRHLL
ncbi:hypothetical protein NHX12_029041 [Muraenolepis orangiensis]|uniref:Uncharacterized protein n=1 Tax=Muraenolepis orangiensis TaxID=630683 RepID=A0A9Q0IN37_9TELE|nr:hypothetical protein NHX12_029041 [Muraenolepis orangiensis]